jgi:RHS repeat-associated protein
LPSLIAGSSLEHTRWLGRAPDDGLGLVMLGQRVYSPALGRFLCPDWYVIDNPQRTLGAPGALNAYAYGLGNPLRYRDPSGAWFGWDDLIVAGIGFVVGFAVGAYIAHKRGDAWWKGALEGAIVGAVGAWLGYNTGNFVFSKLGFAPGWLLGKVGISVSVSAKTLAIAGAIIGGLNGALSGGRRIYDWSDETGYAAFISDSTWGLTGTALGLLTSLTASGYRDDLSKRSNRHIYDGGFGFGGSAHTQGNVTTNWNNRSNQYHLSEHEAFHAFQSRFFGPVYQLSYVSFLVVGGFAGLVMAPFTDQDWTQDVKDVGYYDNPWELWAYTVGGLGGGRGTLGWDPS